MVRFNVLFDKRTGAGLPSWWDQQGNILPWETYETSLVEAKSKIGNTHENIVILKGATIVNYLHKDFQLLWVMKTLFLERTSYSRIIYFRIAHVKLANYSNSNVDLWRKCKEWMSPQANDEDVGTSSIPGSQAAATS